MALNSKPTTRMRNLKCHGRGQFPYAFCALPLALCLAACAALAGDSQPAYVWKANDLFRFDIQKTVRIADDDTTAEERRTEFAAVAIIEVKSISAAGASATLRFDSPRVNLPPIYVFTSQNDEKPELQSDRNRSVARAIEGALKTARWNILLAADGSITVESRTPASLAEFTREVANAGQWRSKKQQKELADLIEQNLGLAPQSIDTDFLLCTRPPPDIPAGSARLLHPVRADFKTEVSGGKLRIGFVRRFPAGAETGFNIPSLIQPRPVNILPQKIVQHEAVAVFDSRMGMLDTLNDEFSVQLKCQSGSETLAQNVRVQYRLKRLAPAITRPE